MQRLSTACLFLVTAFFAYTSSASAQEINMNIYASGGDPWVNFCITIPPSTSPVCPALPLSDGRVALDVFSIHRLLAIEDASSETSNRVRALDGRMAQLGEQIDGLTATLETAHNNQLIAIRDQIVSRLDNIPLEMINDPHVIEEIRGLVISEVEAAFRNGDAD